MADEAYFRTLPKVALHDHLDGGVRPQTLIEIAAEVGHQLPADSATELGDWFFEAASSGTLARYLETFDHTIACMQRAEDLQRVAREWVADQVADGVIAAEARWAPAQHTARGLSLDEAVEAVGAGMSEGIDEAAANGRSFVGHQLVTAMRHADDGVEIAELALRHRGHDLVAGFDIAGGETGNLPSRQLPAFQRLREDSFYYTIHAGEEGPLESMHEAVHICGALRLGHGVNIAHDITRGADGSFELGPLASFIRNQQIPLEVCPSSNLQTGVADQIAAHPFGMLLELGFNVTLSCDNRLMSRTTLSREYALVSEGYGLSVAELRPVAVAGARGLFLDHDQRNAVAAQIDRAWASAASFPHA